MSDVLAAANLTGASTAIIAILVVGIGIAMAFKGASFGKRAIRAS